MNENFSNTIWHLGISAIFVAGVVTLHEDAKSVREVIRENRAVVNQTVSGESFTSEQKRTNELLTETVGELKKITSRVGG